MSLVWKVISATSSCSLLHQIVLEAYFNTLRIILWILLIFFSFIGRILATEKWLAWRFAVCVRSCTNLKRIGSGTTTSMHGTMEAITATNQIDSKCRLIRLILKTTCSLPMLLFEFPCKFTPSQVVISLIESYVYLLFSPSMLIFTS